MTMNVVSSNGNEPADNGANSKFNLNYFLVIHIFKNKSNYKKAMENNDSTLSPFPGPNLQAHQSPGLCSNKSTSISLSSTPVGLSSAADTFLTTEPAEIATVDLLSKIENGKVDLSGKQLTALTDAGGKPRKGKRADGGEAPTIFQLNVAQNSLRSLDCANLPLQQCIEIDASHNVLSQMRCLSPLATHLVHLRLSDNRISSLGSLNSFCCLQTLDLSHNRIEHFPVLDQLTRLHHLNLASNHIKSVPNLSRLTSLVELDLHGNAICSLEFVRNFLPKDFLRSLDIGGNLLSDLCEFNHFNSCGLFLDALIVMGNPCTRMINVSQRTFSYRSFIYSCVLGDLKLLDGYFLNESEIIKGEWLHAQGHSRSFRPGTGTHDQLCAYLEKECSSKQDEMSLIEDDKLSMVIQKRREYNRSQSSTVITAKIGENVVKMDEQKAGKEKRITPAQRQQKMAIGNRNGEKKTAKVDSGGRTHSKKKTTTALAEKSDGRTKTTKAQQPTQLVRMSKSVTQLTSSRTTTNSEEEEEEEEAEEQFPPKERSHSAMDGFDTNRTVTTLVHESPVSPAHTIVLSGSSFDIVRLDLSKNESNQQHQQQFHAQPSALPPPPPLSPSPPSASTSALPVCPASSTSQFLPFSSTVSSPVSSRIPVNVTSLTARSLRYRQHNMLQKGGDATAIQQQQEEQQQKKPLRPIPSSSLSMVGGHRQKFVNQSERKMGATRRKSTTADQQQKEESTCSSKGSRKKGRFINLARKFNIRRKPSIGLHQSKRLSPASAPPQQTPRTLKGKVDELTMQNNLLTRINGEHVLTFQELATKIEQLEKEMSVRHAQDQHLRSLLIPTPANFKCKRHENEKGNDVLEIVWDNVIPLMSAVDSYELFLNGQQCKIKAKNRRLRITDLNPAEDIKVSICALSSALDGVRSATSEVIVSKHCADEEGKENSASMLDRPFPLIK